MCGRFDLDQSNREIDKLLAALPPGTPPIKNGEIFPTNIAPVLLLRGAETRPEALAWGFPRWDSKGVLFNARSESALSKPIFRKRLLENPVAIPTTGFYEWRTDPESGQKQKFRFTDPDESVLWLAGFAGFFPEEDLPHRFTILTTEANPSVRPFHARMPHLLRTQEIDPWLRGLNREQILTRQPFALTACPG